MKAILWRSPLILTGLGVWLLCLVVWGIAWVLDARAAAAMGATFGAFLLGGKLAAIPTGLSFKLAPPLVAFVVFAPDLGAVLVSFPLLDRGWKAAGRFSHMLADLQTRAVRDAQERRGLVARFGSWGILLLSVTPVALISPIVVAAIGELMGFSARRILVPVISAMAVMTTVLVTLFAIGLGFAARAHPAIPFVITGLIVAAVLSREIILRRRAKKAEGDKGSQ